MTLRLSARLAALGIVAAEATAVATRAHDPSTLTFRAVFVALQVIAVGWATDRRSAATLRMVAPALLTAVTATALWTASALAVPPVANGNTAALVAILAAGLVVAATSRRGAGDRLLPLTLIASATTALLLFLAISWIFPAVPGFISNSHPPTFTDVTRLVDPVGEFALFLLLTAATVANLARTRIRTRRATAREQRPPHPAAPNEMVVERPVQVELPGAQARRLS
jgi:hypothetical protein